MLFLIVAPVVIAENERAVAVVEFEDGVGQLTADAGGGEGGTDAADNHLGRGGAADDETADHDVGPQADLTAGGDVAHTGDGWRKIVELAEGNAGGAIQAAQHSGVAAGGQADVEDRFERIGGL